MISELSKRIHLLPTLVAGCWAIYGNAFQNWRVAEVFFWFWYEFVLTGIAVLFLVTCWCKIPGGSQRQKVAESPIVFLFAFLMILLFLSMFAGMAYRGEWKDWSRFPEFLTNKVAGLVTLLVAQVLTTTALACRPEFGLKDANVIGIQFGRKSAIVLACYIIFLIQGWIQEWAGRGGLQVTPAYLRFMALSLIVAKLMAELGVFDWLWRRRPKG